MVALTTFTVTTRNVERFAKEVGLYFLCEAVGPEDPCDRNRFEELLHPELTAISFILLGLFPAVNLVFVINVNELKQWCRRFSHYHVPKSSENPSAISTSSAL